MNKRVFALVVAAIIALLAGGAVVAYVSKADTRAVAGQQAKEVYIATKSIARGTTLGAATKSGAVVKDVLPVKSVPSNAVTKLGANTLVATSDVASGEVILEGRFATTADAPQVLSVPAGKLAVSAELNNSQRVGSFIKPGDWVAVFFYEKDKNTSSALLSRVQVLGVGLAYEKGVVELEDKNSDEKTKDTVVTLAVAPAEALKLVQAENSGEVHLGLLTGGEAVPVSLVVGSK